MTVRRDFLRRDFLRRDFLRRVCSEIKITTNDPHALEGFHAHAEVIGLEQYMLQGYIKANSRLHSRTTAVVAEIMI